VASGTGSWVGSMNSFGVGLDERGGSEWLGARLIWVGLAVNNLSEGGKVLIESLGVSVGV